MGNTNESNTNVNNTNTMSESERESVSSFMRNLSPEALQIALREIHSEWLWWELHRRFEENDQKVQGFEMILKGVK